MTLVNIAFGFYGYALGLIVIGALVSLNTKKWTQVIGMAVFAFLPAAVGVILHLIGTK